VLKAHTKRGVQRLNGRPFCRKIAGFPSEPVAEKQKPTSREVRLRLDLLVALWAQCVSVVTVHDVVVPRDQAVPDLMGLIPAMLLLGERGVQ
jgi:hypothetical protein